MLQAFNGCVSIIPGYDDLLLNRGPDGAPVVPRRDGDTLVDHFAFAQQAGATLYLVYGWNEYFEDTVIEPTLEDDGAYARLTAHLIAQVRRGAPVSLPPHWHSPRKASSATILAGSAGLRPNGIPYWGGDYSARIEVEEITSQSVRALITNAGRRVWQAASKPIRLGGRLSDRDGAVVREFRGELGADVAAGDTLVATLPFDTNGLAAGDYDLTVDLVWEHRFWFGDEGSTTIHIPLTL
jgi:hypothetical protein